MAERPTPSPRRDYGAAQNPGEPVTMTDPVAILVTPPAVTEAVTLYVPNALMP